MFCIKCGNEIPGDFIFCPKCGTPTINNNTVNRPSTNHVVEERQPIMQTRNTTKHRSIMNSKSIKIIVGFIIGIVILCIVSSLTKENPKTQKILNYLNGNTKKEFANAESKMIESINSFLGDSSKTEEEIYKEVSEKTIVYARQMYEIANNLLLEIDDDELRNVHKLMIDYSDSYVQICTKLLSAIETHDQSELDEIKKYREKANKLAEEYTSKLTALANKNGVTIKNAN